MSENMVENYGWNHDEGPPSCGYITPEIIKILGDLQSKRVADVGCGNGALCRAIQGRLEHVVGIEYDRNGCDIARRECPGMPVYNMGVQDSPDSVIDKEGYFDTVVSSEVIEHLFSPHLLPLFAGRLLEYGGHLIITTPYHGYLKNLLLSLCNKWDHHHTALWHGGHIKFWSRSTLTQLLHDNGFEVVRFSGVGRLPYLWKSMVLVARKVG